MEADPLVPGTPNAPRWIEPGQNFHTCGLGSSSAAVWSAAVWESAGVSPCRRAISQEPFTLPGHRSSPDVEEPCAEDRLISFHFWDLLLLALPFFRHSRRRPFSSPAPSQHHGKGPSFEEAPVKRQGAPEVPNGRVPSERPRRSW